MMKMLQVIGRRADLPEPGLLTGTPHAYRGIVVAATAALAALSYPAARAAAADSNAPAAEEWPNYNNEYKGQRFSPLTEISSRNVESLEEVCRLKVSDSGSLQTGPVVVGQAMYLTTLLDTFAI